MNESPIDADRVRSQLEAAGLTGEDVDHAIRALPRTAIGILLYGSRARGDFDEASDVDLLVVASEHRRTAAVGRSNVSTYSIEQLKTADDSIFGMHLSRDGLVIHDTDETLTELLRSFKDPDPANVLGNVQQLSVTLNSEPESRSTYLPGLVRLARYLLRTALYAKALETGKPCFSVREIAARANDPALAGLLTSRAPAEASTLEELAELERRLETVIGPIGKNPYATLEALIVATWQEEPNLANTATLALQHDGSNDPYSEIPRIVL